MIIDQFIDEEEIIRPPGFYKRKEKILDVCLITFSHEIFSFAKNMEGSVVVGEMHAADGVYEIIKLLLIVLTLYTEIVCNLCISCKSMRMIIL